MTDKDIVKYIIKHKGNCYNAPFKFSSCPLGTRIRMCTCGNSKTAYSNAIAYYIQEYGKESLIEFLI